MQEALDRMFTPLIPGFEHVSCREFLINEFEGECEIEELGIGVDELVQKIPEELHERMREDALEGMKTYQLLIEDTIRVSAANHIFTGAERPLSFNASCMEDLKTALAVFLDENSKIWDEHEFIEYTESIEDENGDKYIEDREDRKNVAFYVKNFISYGMACIPYVLDESKCIFECAGKI